MMKIGKDNYEEYALDYIEGNLSDAQSEEFRRFLDTDEAVRDEVSFLMAGMPLVTPEENPYPAKKSLFRKTPLRRAMPYLSGAVAASVLLCLFLWISPSGSKDMEQTDNLAAFAPKKGTHSDIKEIANADKPDLTKLPDKKEAAAKLPARNNKVEKESEPRTSGVVAPVIHKNEIEASDGKREYYEVPVMAGNVITYDMIDDLEIEKSNEQKEISIPARLTVSHGSELLAAAANFGDGLQTPGGSFRRGLSVLLAPVEQVLPVNRFQAGNSKGIEIASLIRITKQIRK